MYYSQKEWMLLGFRKSKTEDKRYGAYLQHKKNERIIIINFGSTHYESYHDKTGLDLYNHLIHGDNERRKKYITHNRVFLREGYYSSSFFSYYYLW